MEDNLVSIIITTYKRADRLENAIESVLNQSYSNIEVIVVDDNDNKSEFRIKTQEKMKQFSNEKRVIYLKHEKNMNGAAARNTGIAKARGKYIGFLDDDDIFEQNRISLLVDALESDICNKYGGAYSDVETIYKKRIEKLSTEKLVGNGNFKKEMLLQEFSIGSGSNMFFRADVVRKLNGFDTNFLRHQDVEFMIRFFREHSLIYINKVLLYKYMDSTINRPNSYKLEEVKSIFIKKFYNDIEEYDNIVKNKILFINDIELIESLLRDLRIKKATSITKKWKKYMTPSIYKKYIQIVLKSLVKKCIRYRG